MISGGLVVEQALNWARNQRQEHLDQLKELLAIPSVSTQPQHQGDIARAADWLAGHMRAIGLKQVAVYPTSRHPIVYGQWTEAPGAPTVLIYGHYDVQPPDPLELWRTPPFEPTVRQGDLYARGAADDKGQLFIHLKALQAFLQTVGRAPVNLKFLLEGEEEIGSPSLEGFVSDQRDLLAADVALISDSHILAPDQPALVYGLRGLCYMEIEVQGPAQDLHSGSYGGAIHNPAEVLCQIVGALKDAQGRIAIPGFYDRVRPISDEERAELARVPFSEAQFVQETGVARTWGEQGYSVLEQIGARPTLDVNGFVSGYTGEGAKTIIPAWARAKVSMRLVAQQDPDEIRRLFTAHVRTLAPDSVRLTLCNFGLAKPALVDRDIPAMQAAAHAYQRAFGVRPVFIREGGSIPVVTLLKDELGLDTILMGFGLPDDNIHGPNEKLHLDNFYRGIETAIHFFDLINSHEGGIK
jgi:acetylornithine deacetylase/succinyl-diaminopimelate desuccinylase-like protein